MTLTWFCSFARGAPTSNLWEKQLGLFNDNGTDFVLTYTCTQANARTHTRKETKTGRFGSQVISCGLQLLVEGNRKSKQAPRISPFPKNMFGVQIESCSLEVPWTPQTQQMPTLGHVLADPQEAGWNYGACAIWRRGTNVKPPCRKRD